MWIYKRNDAIGGLAASAEAGVNDSVNDLSAASHQSGLCHCNVANFASGWIRGLRA